LNTHYFMPAHLVPAVEVVSSEATDPKVADHVCAMLRATGRVPVRVKRDIPGFLANRLQHALSREAFWLMEQGFCEAEDIDAAVRFGFGFRYIAAGPCLQRDHAGLEVHAAAGAEMYPHFNNSPDVSSALTDRVAANKLGMKTGEGFYQWTPETIAADFETFVSTVRDKAGPIPIDFLAIKPSPKRLALLREQMRANRLVSDVARRHPEVSVIDVFSPLLDPRGEPDGKLFAADRLHLGPAGYALWNRVVGEHLTNARPTKVGGPSP
jgi:3-hydroxyacyl-CoA dehydrogenase